MKKEGQMNLSFGMIFSILLIIFFVAFVFYVIPKFLDFQKRAQVGMFIQDFQEDIDKMWEGTYGSEEKTYNLPKKIEFFCFEEDSRIFFKPLGSGYGWDSKEIKHLKPMENGFCIENTDGEIKIIIKKDYGESLVDIEK